MDAEQLIAFEAALAELSNLYVVAKDFLPLRQRAESELLPATAELGSRLRRLVRQGSAGADQIDAAARETAGLRQKWRDELDALRASPLYQSCLHAHATQDRPALRASIPQLFAECTHDPAPPALHFPVSPTGGRRRPGNSPFLTPDACAARLIALREDGITPDSNGQHWWEQELVPLSFVADPEILDTPLALRFDPAAVADPVFRMAGSDTYRIYATSLRAPFVVVLQDEVDDEWWQAFSGSYQSWRTELAAALAARGIPVAVGVYDHE